jgi:hypothetical protein
MSDKFEAWLSTQSGESKAAIFLRAALRMLVRRPSEKNELLLIFRAVSASRYSLLNPNKNSFAREAAEAFRTLPVTTDVAHLAFASTFIAGNLDSELVHSLPIHILSSQTLYRSTEWDMSTLSNEVPVDRLLQMQLWYPGGNAFELSKTVENREVFERRLKDGAVDWRVWVDWYRYVEAGTGGRAQFDNWERAYLDPLPWHDVEATNAAIRERLSALAEDTSKWLVGFVPAPIAGINAPINVVQLPNGRIAVAPGPSPEVEPMQVEGYENLLSTCRTLARELASDAGDLQFGKDYGRALSNYLKRLPKSRGQGGGNIALADSEARILTRLFTAHVGLLNDGFASRLSVLLENHQALRARHPELQRNYEDMVRGRITTPIQQDAVEKLQKAIHDNPTIFDLSITEIIDEIAEPILAPNAVLEDDVPTLQPGQRHPVPPPDHPQDKVEPTIERSYLSATIANGIWKILLDGEHVGKSLVGWHKAYAQIRPIIGPILSWLRDFWFGYGGGGTPPTLPPTIDA